MGNSKVIGIQGEADNWEKAIRLCGEALIQNGCVDIEFMEGCINREREYPTGLPSEIPVAIPHFQSAGIKETSICVLRLNKPVIFYRMDSSDEYVETNLIFNLAIKGANNHLEYLQKLMALVTDKDKMQLCVERPMDEVLRLIEDNLI